MKIQLSVNYKVDWEQELYIVGSIPELGSGDENQACLMRCESDSLWQIEINVDNPPASIEYRYLIKENDTIIRREEGLPHQLALHSFKEIFISDYWRDFSPAKPFFSSAFVDSIQYHAYSDKLIYYDKTLLINLECFLADKDQVIAICGDAAIAGNWNYTKKMELKPIAYGQWALTLNVNSLPPSFEYKYVIYDKKRKQIIHWEERDNRVLISPDIQKKEIVIEMHEFQPEKRWKAAGVSIPVFSLKTEDSFGIGEFPDLKKMIDWAVITRQKIIQILPINDTTVNRSWRDSYPYSVVSIYALHPIYLGLKNYPLKSKTKLKGYLKQASVLNALPQIDYEQVLQLKLEYVKDLFTDIGKQTFDTAGYKEFYEQNSHWLFPYACFCCLRDKHETADYSKWQIFDKYDQKQLQKWVDSDPQISEAIQLSYFIQYLLHSQLGEVEEYAHQNGVVLKGDIPIGINRYSVEAWSEPHLFNLDTQTGAPPDDFSKGGQNWGFPTYNWSEMAKDNYQWWVQRFKKMTDYFDAYRIDHILGFFRIWEIPNTSIDALLGYFSPAIPLSIDEIESYGLLFDRQFMTKASVHKNYLPKLFGAYTTVVIEEYLESADSENYTLKPFCNTQIAIKSIFEDRTDIESKVVCEGLYRMCNEVLFIEDKYQSDKFHPRISIHDTFKYNFLDEGSKDILGRIYEDFYFHRHNEFWYNEAMKKLPVLLSSTQMLVCAEDLGMIPACVPDVIRELEMLSLEIERMPKVFGQIFANLQDLPYLSVCTTSTHDMSPIRAWWLEDTPRRQLYYNQVLGRNGSAPMDCTPDICTQILEHHLTSQSMLTIFPLQDWLSINERLRYPDPEEERINVPSIPDYYWKYRMHLTIEDLIEADDFNTQVISLLDQTGRS